MPSKYRHPAMDGAMTKIRRERGLATKIARACNVSRAAVYQWRAVPPQWIYQVADVTGMTPEEIRPDIFRRPKKRRA
jgi:DNA-binding transcriptional regulator YdaS (Cro superfamily)